MKSAANKKKQTANFDDAKNEAAQMEKFAQYSMRAKALNQRKLTIMIGKPAGKPAGKKNVDDRVFIDEMRTLLSQGQQKGPTQFKGTTSNDLRLEFSQSTMVEYMNHKKVATGILYNPNAKCFMSYNEKGIHVWNPQTGKKVFVATFELGNTQDLTKPKSFNEANRQISCVCYSKKWHLYFACTKNFRLLVFNEYLNCVEDMPLNMRLVQKCLFVDGADGGQLITAGVKGCFIVQLRIHYTYAPKQAILLNPKGDSITVEFIKAVGRNTCNDYYKFQRIGKWVKGLKLDLKQGYFVCWSDRNTYFYEFSTEKETQDNVSLPVVFEDLTAGVRARIIPAMDDAEYSEESEEKDDAYLKHVQPRQDADCITDVLLYNPMHYFVVSTVLGHMLVFKWDFKMQTKQVMHTFKGHSRTVTSMKLIKNSYSSFVSASLDGSIRVWCLDKFIQLYTFQTDAIQSNALGTQVTDIRLLDDRVFAVISKGPIKVTIGQISHLAKSYFISQPPITALSKAFTSVDNSNGNQTDSLISTFDNNSVLLLDPETGAVKSTIYPPPTPTNIQKTLYSMALKRIFVFLQTGTFCVYKVEGRETATLEKLQFPKQLKDYENKSLSQSITALTLCCMRPPKLDSEIFSEAFKYNPNASMTQKTEMKEGQDEVLASSSSSQEESDQDIPKNNNMDSDGEEGYDEQVENFLLMGLSKGSVIFVKVQKIELIYARFSVHKQQINHIQELQKQKAILTMCEENQFKIWGFVDGRMQIWKSFNIHRPISTMKVIDDPSMLLITFSSGESYYFGWSHKHKNLRIVLPDEENYFQTNQENEDGLVVSENPRRNKQEFLNELLKTGLLMNGNFEHDDEVNSIDVHCGYKLIASGDAQGLIKIWNYRRQLIREIKFTEPITAVCFLNARADLVVGHKGKISRIRSRDYLPDQSLFKVPSPSEVREIFKKSTVEIQEDFFSQLKQQNDETAFANERLRRKQKAPEVEQNKALMTHLGTLFKQTPKFGMPMDQFKALLQKDDRIPKLQDKRLLVNALQAKLANEMANEVFNGQFQTSVFQNALKEALREQDRIQRLRPHAKKDTSPVRGNGGGNIPQSNVYSDRMATQSSTTGAKENKNIIMPWRQGLKKNKRPGSTKALPISLGSCRPHHPKNSSTRTTQPSVYQNSGGGGAKTRYQMTQDRIMDNIKYFNKPAPDTQMNILMIGQQLETHSIFSERRPVSRQINYRSKGTMSSIEADKAVSDLQGQLQHFMSASHVNFQQNSGVSNVQSTHDFNHRGQIHPYQASGGAEMVNFRQQRKNLASANIFGRRGEASRVISAAITDSISQPDFSMGVPQEANSVSGPGTAAGTDSVRPTSQPGFKIYPSKGSGTKIQKHMRPTTVGGAPGSKLFRRSDYTRLMRSTANQNSNNMQHLVDDFMINGDETNQQIKVNLMGRNMLNTASYDQTHSNQITNQVPQLSMAASQPAKGFPARQQKKNIRVRDMKTPGSAGRITNAAIANIQRHISVGKNQIQPEPQSAEQIRDQEILGATQSYQAGSTTAEALFNLPGESTQARQVKNSSGTELKIGTLGKGGLPSQVIEMNENVRELVIDASMRLSRPQTKQSLMDGKNGVKRPDDSSGMSHTTKGFMGNTPVLNHNQTPQNTGTELINSHNQILTTQYQQQ